jgi:RNA polymerase sigma-70 factor (ECF subfamily)
LKYADLSGTIHASHQQTEDEVMLASFSVIAEAGISRLSAQKKRIFQMRTQCGLSNEEVATQLGISIGTVKVQFSQATKFLRDYLEKFAGISSALLGAVIKYLLS